MSDSKPSFAEKILSQDSQDDHLSYKSVVSSARKRNPSLAHLDEVLTEESSQSGRVAVVEFYETHVSERRFTTSNELLKYMSCQEPSNTSKCKGRLYLLEGLPQNYIEVLGSQLHVDPVVFARQVKCGLLNFSNDVRDVPLLSSHPTSKKSLHLRYHELRDFEDGINGFELYCTNQRRRISVTKWNGKFDGVGIIRRSANFWSRLNKQKGWDALILLDPPVGDHFFVGSGINQTRRFLPNRLYRGGYVDFSPPVKSNLEFDNSTAGPKRKNALDDLCYYIVHSKLTRELDFSSPAAVTTFLKRYGASHWMVLLQYSLDLLCKYEHTYHGTKLVDLSSSSLENCWSDVQYLNDRTASWCHQIEDLIRQFTASKTLGDFPGQPNNDTNDEDFVQIYRQLQNLKQRVQIVISSVSGLISIVETKRMKELSNLGMLFIPLAFTSGIFSMSGNYAPGGSSFWVYWVVAVPLVLLVFFMAFCLNSRPALVSSRLLKTRLSGIPSLGKRPRRSSPDLG